MRVNIDVIRRFYLSIAEATDAWRIVPRVLVTGYGYLLYQVIRWYMELVPYMLDGCVSETITDCIVESPTTQHAALVTAVVGVAAAFFGLYANSGQKWDRYMFRKWKTDTNYTNYTDVSPPEERKEDTTPTYSQYSKRQSGLSVRKKPTRIGTVGAPPIRRKTSD